MLIGLGLTPNQAKVYQTLLKIGSYTVIQIAKSSSVRREDVYKVLPALEKMGLAEKLLGKPALIRATPVAGALKSLILDEKVKSDTRIATMKMKFQELSETKWVQPLAPGKDESLFAIIPEGKAIIAKFASLISGSKIGVFWIGNSKEVSHVACLLSSEIKSAIHRGVEVKVIIEDFNSDQNQKKQVQQCLNIDAINIRFHTSPLKKFAAFDGKDAIISTERGNVSEDTSSLWTNDANLIGILKGYFDSAWSESKEIDNQQSIK